MGSYIHNRRTMEGSSLGIRSAIEPKGADYQFGKLVGKT